MQSSFQSLQFALALAVFLVYLVMASQFESLIHPFVILFTIPLALVGAVLALFITGTTLNIVALIGVIMLAGIVVNNAIVLVDLINQLRAQGMQKIDAIMEAGKARTAPDPDDIADDSARPAADGAGLRRRLGDTGADGDYRNWRTARLDGADVDRNPGGVLTAGPQNLGRSGRSAGKELNPCGTRKSRLPGLLRPLSSSLHCR